MDVRVGRIGFVLGLSFFLGACSMTDRFRYYHGLPPSYDYEFAEETTKAQEELLKQLIIRAGLERNVLETKQRCKREVVRDESQRQVQGESREVIEFRDCHEVTKTPLEIATHRLQDTNWKEITRAGINLVDEQCEQYVDALHRYDRANRVFTNQLARTAAAAGTALGIAGAATNALAYTALAFGYVIDSANTVAEGLLFKLNPSGVRVLIERSQQTYYSGIKFDKIRTRPQAFRAIRGYLALCLPARLEQIVNETVGATDFVAIDGKRATEDIVPVLKPVSRLQPTAQRNNDVKQGE